MREKQNGDVEKQQEENLKGRLRYMEQQLTSFQRGQQQLSLKAQQLQNNLSVKEDETGKLRKQVNDLERQLRDRDQDIVKLKKACFESEEKLKKYQSQETHDWIIPRDEIVTTDKRLGSGGWGYVVEGKYCGSTVAVKRLNDQFAVSPYNRKKFEREMDIASRCRHPCLLQFIGATNDEGSPLFVTELMESSLRTLLEKRSLSAAEVYIFSLDVARALTYLHQKKPTPILHRDVSSANVLLWRHADQWRGKVSDYGTANFLQETMTIDVGAMIYSAPEASTPRQTVKVSYKKVLKLASFCLHALVTYANSRMPDK